MDTQKPLYKLEQKTSRVLIPQTLTLTLLSVFFYAGILLNLVLLKLKGDTENTVKMVGLLLVILLIIIGVLVKYKKVKKSYSFFADRVYIKDRGLLYTNITVMTKSQKFMDKVFKTYTLTLSPDFKLENISNSVDIEAYIKQMIEYNRRQNPQPYYS